MANEDAGTRLTTMVRGTIDGRTAVIDIPSMSETAGDEKQCTVQWGDGATSVAMSGSTVEHEFSEPWYGQFLRDHHDDARIVNRITTVIPSDTRFPATYVKYAGMDDMEQRAVEDDAGTEDRPWETFRTHQEFTDFLTARNIDESEFDDWSGKTLTEKRDALDAYYAV